MGEQVFFLKKFLVKTTMTANNGDFVLQSFITRHKQIPSDPNQLVSFSRQDVEIPTIGYSEAKKALSKIKTSIKSGKKKKSFKKTLGGTQYRVGDEVLISKDRTGILRYIGPVPEMGDDATYYGLELTCGTLGQNDGAIKGKRYFQVSGKRGMFIPERKLRRKLNSKDKERRNSYAEISNQVKELQKQYVGDAANFLYPTINSGAQSTSPPINAQYQPQPQHKEKMNALDFDNRDDGADQYQHQSQIHRKGSSENNDIKKKKKKKKITRLRSHSGASSGSRGKKIEKSHSYTTRTKYEERSDEEGSDEEEESTKSDMSDLDEERENAGCHGEDIRYFVKVYIATKGWIQRGSARRLCQPTNACFDRRGILSNETITARRTSIFVASSLKEMVQIYT